jgi:hypothetical protein
MLAIETFGDRHQTVFTEYPIISRSGGNNDSGAVRITFAVLKETSLMIAADRWDYSVSQRRSHWDDAAIPQHRHETDAQLVFAQEDGYMALTLPRQLAFEGVKLETRQSMRYRSEIRTSPLRLDQMKQREVKKFCIALINID